MKLKEIKQLALEYDQEQSFDNDIISQYRGKSIAIKGDKGTGKTSFMAAITNIFYMLNYQQKKISHRIKIKELRSRGFIGLKPLGHLIYNDDGKQHIIFNLGLGKIDAKAMRREWFKNIFRSKTKKNNELIFNEEYKPSKPWLFKYKDLRMPSASEKFIHAPYGSIFCSSEVVDRIYNSKGSEQDIDTGKLDFIQKIRHGNITLVDETQMWERCQKWLRDTVSVLIYIKNRTDYDDRGKVIPKEICENGFFERSKSVWTVWIYEGSKEVIELGYQGVEPLNSKELKNLKRSKENDIRTRIYERKITFYGDINKYYNPRSHEYEFCYNLAQYEVDRERDFDGENFTKAMLDKEFDEEKKTLEANLQAEKDAKINKKIEDEEIKNKAKELYNKNKANIDTDIVFS